MTVRTANAFRRQPDPERDLHRGESPWPVGADEWEALACRTARRRALRLHRRRRRQRVDDACEPRGVRAAAAAAADAAPATASATSRSRCSGHASPFPFFLAPIGVLSIAHPDGELAPARAAAAVRVPFILSSAASHSIEEIADAMGDAPRWFQLYWVSDREVVASLVRRAEAAGYGAIVVTLDTLTLGWRPRDLRNAYLPFREGEGSRSSPAIRSFASASPLPPEEDPLVAAATMLVDVPEPCAALGGPRLAPRADVAAAAREGCADRRGRRARARRRRRRHRRLESRRPPGRRRGRLARRAGRGARRRRPDAPVLMDGGIRGGADVVKALALGANAVLLGRPYVVRARGRRRAGRRRRCSSSSRPRRT